METKADGLVEEQGCKELEVQGRDDVDQAEPVNLRTVEGQIEETAGLVKEQVRYYAVRYFYHAVRYFQIKLDIADFARNLALGTWHLALDSIKIYLI